MAERKIKVLLVEDSATMRRAVQIVLAGEPYSLTTTPQGDEALSIAHEIVPDLVIADLSLADKDGYEICRELREDPILCGVPVLLLHGSSVQFDEARAEQVQATGAIAKPFASDELLEKVAQLTRG